MNALDVRRDRVRPVVASHQNGVAAFPELPPPQLPLLLVVSVPGEVGAQVGFGVAVGRFDDISEVAHVEGFDFRLAAELREVGTDGGERVSKDNRGREGRGDATYQASIIARSSSQEKSGARRGRNRDASARRLSMSHCPFGGTLVATVVGLAFDIISGWRVGGGGGGEKRRARFGSQGVTGSAKTARRPTRRRRPSDAGEGEERGVAVIKSRRKQR